MVITNYVSADLKVSSGSTFKFPALFSSSGDGRTHAAEERNEGEVELVNAEQRVGKDGQIEKHGEKTQIKIKRLETPRSICYLDIYLYHLVNCVYKFTNNYLCPRE